MESPSKRFLQTIWRFVWQLTVSTAKHDIASLAAVIAFYAFFSLFPLLVLVIYAASLMLPNSHTENVLIQLVTPYFPALHDAKQFIQLNISRLAQLGSKIGLVSAVTLAWSATSGFIAVQQAMDVIWETPQQRSYLVRRLIAFLMLVVLLLFTIGSAVMMAVYPAVHKSALDHLGWLHWFQVLHGVSRVLFPLSLFLGCLVFYRYLPSRATPWFFLIPGAFVAAVALDLGRRLFVWYALHFVTYQMIYGTLAVTMLLVLWMYIASIVMLFGAEVSAALAQVGADAADMGPNAESDGVEKTP